jgi:hypothetical protein
VKSPPSSEILVFTYKTARCHNKRPWCEPLPYCHLRSTNFLILFGMRENLHLFCSSEFTLCGNRRYCLHFGGRCCLHFQGRIGTLVRGISFSKLILKVAIVWDMKLWSHVDCYRRFGITLCLHLHRFLLLYRQHYSNLRDKINLNKPNYQGMPFLSPSAYKS